MGLIDWRDFGLRTLLWLTLGGWIGSWGLFAMVIAPTAFRVIPSTAVAGELVGHTLSWLHLYGVVGGLVLSGLAVGLGRSRPHWVLPLLLSAVCLASHFGVTAAISDVRPHEFGPQTEADAAARFAFLHRISLWLFGGVSIGAITLVGLHAHADTARWNKDPDSSETGCS